MDRRTEERLNAVTHGVGAIASVLGGIVLVWLAARFGDGLVVVSVVVYSITLVGLYLASTLYHSARVDRWRDRLRVFDHCAIYLLIAGSFTPFALGPLRGMWGWALLAFVWGLALVGIAHRCFFANEPDGSARRYLAMSFACLLPFLPAVWVLPAGTVVLLAVGGVTYMVGTIFYSSRRIRYAHPIWHGFVLAGSALHFAAILTQLT